MAKKFSFRLEPILKIKNYKASLAKDTLNQVIATRIRKEEEINHKNGYLDNLVNQKTVSTNAMMIQAHYHHKNYVKEEIKKLEKEKFQILEIENLRRIELTEAMKEEKILEKLKEKKQAIHKFEVDKEEMNNLDEIGRNRYIKQNILGN